MTLEVGRQSGISLVEILSFENSFVDCTWSGGDIAPRASAVGIDKMAALWPACD